MCQDFYRISFVEYAEIICSITEILQPLIFDIYCRNLKKNSNKVVKIIELSLTEQRQF